MKSINKCLTCIHHSTCKYVETYKNYMDSFNETISYEGAGPFYVQIECKEYEMKFNSTKEELGEIFVDWCNDYDCANYNFNDCCCNDK